MKYLGSCPWCSVCTKEQSFKLGFLLSSCFTIDKISNILNVLLKMLDVTSALRTVAAGVGLKEIEEDWDG